MTWEEARERFPARWLLFEAIAAHSEGGKRIVEQLSVIEDYPDSVPAIQRYTALHREFPQRELLVAHTSRPTLDITERFWHGIRR
jgi:hypothetical protein